MARYLLGSTMYIEKAIQRAELTEEEKLNVKRYLEDPKVFRHPETLQSRKKTEDEEIEAAVLLLLEFAGFDGPAEPNSVQKLKELWMLRLITAGRKMRTAERRKKDGLQLPYKSALEWVLRLWGFESVLDLKGWYDKTYRTRFRTLFTELDGGAHERLATSTKSI